MKKIIYIFGLSLFVHTSNAQILSNSVLSANIPQSNAFLDASTSYSSLAGENNNKHKGLVFPDVNLTTFQFENVIADGTTFPSFYDGMIVYNTATGNTLTTGNNPSTTTSVTPGFYYFSNPNGANNANVTGGIWIALGAGVSKNITDTEAEMPIKINGEQLYAINGTFTASGTSALITVAKPAGMTGYYSFTIYKEGKTFRREIRSFDINITDNNVVTGNGLFSEIIPAGTYNFVLEYFK